MATEAELLVAFEEHSPTEIRRVLAEGVSPIASIKGKRPVDCLIEAYLRTERFPECLRVMAEAGASVGDPLLEALLLDDHEALHRLLSSLPDVLQRKLNPLTAFTSCRGVSALHVCAEFNSIECARVLLDAGADVNARADVNSDGVGGHTPIFHTVNTIFNHCRPMMELLVAEGADLDARVNAILWGESFPWETVVFDVTPISYAQCGLYRQFQRREEHVYDNIEYLYRARFGATPPRRNVPNRYLAN
jgi:ankyrin repeat protein